MVEIQWNPSRRELRLFGLIALPLLLLVISAVLWARMGTLAPLVVSCCAAAISIVLALTAPGLLRPISVGLSVIGFPIAWLVSHAILAFIFFGALMPIGLLLRASGRDPLGRRLDRTRSSYWEARASVKDPRGSFRQF